MSTQTLLAPRATGWRWLGCWLLYASLLLLLATAQILDVALLAFARTAQIPEPWRVNLTVISGALVLYPIGTRRRMEVWAAALPLLACAVWRLVAAPGILSTAALVVDLALLAAALRFLTPIERPEEDVAGIPVGRRDPNVRYAGTRSRITLADIVGMEEAKARLLTAAKTITRPPAGSRPRNGILLFGAPGNGKTYFAQALAGELQLPLIAVTAGDLASRYVNETTEHLVQLFRAATAQAPCVLFFDEFDSLAEHRGSDRATSRESTQLVNTLLAEIVKLRARRVVLVAATNFIERLDRAVVREGRFDFKVEIPPPDAPARLAILSQAVLQHTPAHAISDAALQRAALRWDGFSVKRLQAVGEQLLELRRPGEILYVNTGVLGQALRRV